MVENDLFSTLFPAPGAEPIPAEAEAAAMQGLLAEIAPPEATRGLDLSGLLGSLPGVGEPTQAAGATSPGLNLGSLLSQVGVQDSLVKILMEKFNLPEGLAILLAQGMLAKLSKKKPRAKPRKSSTAKPKPKPKAVAKPKKKTTPKPKTSATKPKPKTSASTAKKKPVKKTPKK